MTILCFPFSACATECTACTGATATKCSACKTGYYLYGSTCSGKETLLLLLSYAFINGRYYNSICFVICYILPKGGTMGYMGLILSSNHTTNITLHCLVDSMTLIICVNCQFSLLDVTDLKSRINCW